MQLITNESEGRYCLYYNLWRHTILFRTGFFSKCTSGEVTKSDGDNDDDLSKEEKRAKGVYKENLFC